MMCLGEKGCSRTGRAFIIQAWEPLILKLVHSFTEPPSSPSSPCQLWQENIKSLLAFFMLMEKCMSEMLMTEWPRFINTKGLAFDIIPDLFQSNWRNVMLHIGLIL